MEVAKLLKREREIFSSVLRKAPYGALLVEKGGSYLYLNEEFTRITGYRLDDVPNARSWFLKAFPEKNARDEAIRTWKKDVTRKVVSRAFTIVCKDGKRKEVEFRSTTVNGDRFVVMLSDITGRKRVEDGLKRSRIELENRVRERTEALLQTNEALQTEINERMQVERSLREREGQLAAIIEGIDGLIYICSEDYRIEFMNDRMARRTGHDGTGLTCYEVLHQRSSICPWCVNERVFKGETVRWEVQSPKDNRWYYIINTPIYHSDGKMSKHALIMDVTEKKSTEDRIKKLNEELEGRLMELKERNGELELLSFSISHDLRSPLVAIEGFSRILSEKYGSGMDEKAQSFLRMIYAGSRRTRELTEDLLSFFKMGRQKFRPSALNMKRIVKETFEELKGMDPHLKSELLLKTLPPALGDRTMVKQVLVNLLGNAIKFSRPRKVPVVEVGSFTRESENVYYVKDNGVGFSSEDSRHLFVAFERLRGAEQFEGTGVGLAIVKRAIQRHGGQVWAEGRVDEGATFFFTLPGLNS
jgi:PAS domain S-box-containing protein